MENDVCIDAFDVEFVVDNVDDNVEDLLHTEDVVCVPDGLVDCDDDVEGVADVGFAKVDVVVVVEDDLYKMAMFMM